MVDLPPEEDQELCLPAQNTGLDFIRLTAPTTDDTRLPQVLNNASGFVYYGALYLSMMYTQGYGSEKRCA